MRFLSRCLLAVSAVVALIAIITPPAAATVYTVSVNPYSASGDLTALELFDSYELVVANGDRVSWVMSTSQGCAEFWFVKGHNANEQSLYYTAYSWTSCTQSYTNTFPVAAGDGTEFSILVVNPNISPVAYTIAITVTPGPAGLSAAVIGGIVAAIIIVLVVVLVVVMMMRKKKPAPQAPPPYPGQQPAYPGAPPQYPPQQGYPPQQPPQAPPPRGP